MLTGSSVRSVIRHLMWAENQDLVKSIRRRSTDGNFYRNVYKLNLNKKLPYPTKATKRLREKASTEIDIDRVTNCHTVPSDICDTPSDICDIHQVTPCHTILKLLEEDTKAKDTYTFFSDENQEEAEKSWEEVVFNLHRELNADIVECWFKKIIVGALHEDVFYVGAVRVVRDWIKLYYSEPLKRALHGRTVHWCILPEDE